MRKPSKRLLKDLVGHVNGRLTVLSEVIGDTLRKNGERYWMCQCTCGGTKVVSQTNIKITQSCGCVRKEAAARAAAGRIIIPLYAGLVISEVELLRTGLPQKKGQQTWICRKPGSSKEWLISAARLRRSTCVTSDGRVQGNPRRLLHSIWWAMVDRCYNTENTHYPNYGGRGIDVCNEWRETSTPFCDWAEVNGHMKGLEIDRRDNDKGYSPENCRFITSEENINNCRLLRSSNTTGYRGVHENRGKFKATVDVKAAPTLRKFGFKTAAAAALARDIHCLRHGVHTPLNFPELAMQGPL